MDVSGNKIAGKWDAEGGGAAIVLTNKGGAAVSVSNYTGAAVPAALADHLRARNNGASASATGSAVAAKSCF